VLVGWIILHLLGNLGAFAGPSSMDGYAAALRRAGPLLLQVRLGVGAAALAHLTTAVLLLRSSRRARLRRYELMRRRAATLASRAMRASGALLLAFLVFHLLHMTIGSLHPAFVPGSVYHNLVSGLSSAPVAVVYLVAAGLLGLHLGHGLFALPRALGWGEGPRYRVARPWALAVAVTIAVGFAVVPAAVLAGVLQ
jgi:succinate dehydrogenase / fumarate reductase cytochrome b subunit